MRGIMASLGTRKLTPRFRILIISTALRQHVMLHLIGHQRGRCLVVVILRRL